MILPRNPMQRRELGADLVVVRSPGELLSADAPLGSVARRLADHAPLLLVLVG